MFYLCHLLHEVDRYKTETQTLSLGARPNAILKKKKQCQVSPKQKHINNVFFSFSSWKPEMEKENFKNIDHMIFVVIWDSSSSFFAYFCENDFFSLHFAIAISDHRFGSHRFFRHNISERLVSGTCYEEGKSHLVSESKKSIDCRKKNLHLAHRSLGVHFFYCKHMWNPWENPRFFIFISFWPSKRSW